MHGALNTCGRWFCLIGLLLCLSACAPILTLVGYSQPAIQIAAQLDRIKFLGDGVSYVGSGKTISDHALSKVAGADCTIFNIAKREPVCASPGAESVATVAPARPRAEAEEPPRPAALETDTQEVATARNFPAEGE